MDGRGWFWAGWIIWTLCLLSLCDASYNSTISACGKAAQWERALDVLDEVRHDMPHKDWRP